MVLTVRRENSAEQQKQFAHIAELEATSGFRPSPDGLSSTESRGWTIFAHAEVGGAVANGGHIASGRISRYVHDAISGCLPH